MDDSAISCYEVIDADAKSNEEGTKTKFITNKATCKTRKFYILLAFVLFAKSLLIAVSIYCYLMKYQAKHLLLFQYANNELRDVLY